MSQKEDEATKAKRKALEESVELGKLDMTFLKGRGKHNIPQKTVGTTRFKKKEKQASVSYRV